MRAPRLIYLLLVVVSTGIGQRAAAQSPQLPGQPLGLDNAPQRDTTKRTADPKWRDEVVRIHYQRAFSARQFSPDTSISLLHRRPVALPYYRDLGNLGSPAQPLYFEPQTGSAGPSLGYHTFDVYRFIPDSLLYYNTTKPYTEFRYQMGTKLEQWVQVLHTQNISPNWNFAFQYRKITSPGFFRIQRTNHDNVSLTSQFESQDLRYRLFSAVVFNSEQHDENGGIVSDTFLASDRYSDRATIPVRFGSTSYPSLRRSPVFNNMRDATFLLQHSYTWGKQDTLYNEDSTAYQFQLTPRFRIAHRLDIGSQRHDYKDLAPDSAGYSAFFNQRFLQGDSVFSRQSWTWIDNSLSLNGLFGPRRAQLRFSAGAGARTDRFRTSTQRSEEAFTDLSTYLFGSVGQELTEVSLWNYDADAKLFLTGPAAGSFQLSGHIRRDFKRLGSLEAGIRQQLGVAPYSHQVYRSDYYERRQSFSQESQTLLYGNVENAKLGVSAGVRNWLLNNYLYLNEKQEFAQYGTAFSVLQGYGQKTFHLGCWVSYNEITLQQVGGTGPVNLPKLAGRHSISLETMLFRRLLKIATGLEARYHTPYAADGYSPFFNRFYFQNGYTVSNVPEATAFFNFQVKRFRGSVSADQLQQVIVPQNNIIRPGYPNTGLMIRFGFIWVLVN